MTDWEKWLKKKSDNIGFISRLGAWREPTQTEISVAMSIETKAWQETIGKKTYKTGAEYAVSVCEPGVYGMDVKSPSRGKRKEAIKAYIETPINIGKETWLIMDWWTAIKHWFKRNKIRIEEKK